MCGYCSPCPVAPRRRAALTRLQALLQYQLLNTMRDEIFSELVRLAAKLFNVLIGIVAFVDE